MFGVEDPSTRGMRERFWLVCQGFLKDPLLFFRDRSDNMALVVIEILIISP
jgi:hypothetical protein